MPNHFQATAYQMSVLRIIDSRVLRITKTNRSYVTILYCTLVLIMNILYIDRIIFLLSLSMTYGLQVKSMIVRILRYFIVALFFSSRNFVFVGIKTNNSTSISCGRNFRCKVFTTILDADSTTVI